MGYNVLSKSCKRCGGDLFLEQGDRDLYYACIQCGAIDKDYSKLLRTKLPITGVMLEEKEKGETRSLTRIR